jgi:hypothetical protein
MDFVTAEEKFNELQARIRRGEPMSEDQYQEELAKLMVQDDSGVFWSLEPGTGRWLYFNGTEWMPGMPPKQAPAPVMVAPIVQAQTASEAPASTSPAYQEPTYTEPRTEAPTSYYAPSDVTQPTEYTGSYAGSQGYTPEPAMSSSPYTSPLDSSTSLDADGMPTYVRMPEADTTNVPTGGIPPRPVREASPLAVPGGERAWLPFAFGALVLLLCAVVLFFGVRGLPQFSGGTASQQPTEEPTEEITDVLPTETVELEPTESPQATEEPTPEPQPTAVPQPFTAAPTDVLNIRQGPARTTPSLGRLQPGQEVVVVGRNADSTWLQIQIPNSPDFGWVSAEFVTTSGDVNTLPVTDGGASPQPQATETPTG